MESGLYGNKIFKALSLSNPHFIRVSVKNPVQKEWLGYDYRMVVNRRPSRQKKTKRIRKNPESVVIFRNKLGQWYRKTQRRFPWRLNPTPYRVWISEIMLQQTQSQTVIPYYESFLKRFPDISSLARASEEDVLSLWSGLGYYGRARNILKAARRIFEFHGGIFPSDYKTVLSLPGIGRYTAGAICSIAFDQPQPIVDGNIRRVITRLQGIQTHVPETYFWNQMTAWVPERKASIFNQAMMELGAVICIPDRPLCLLCPIQSFCRAKRDNLQNSIPVPRSGQDVKNIELVILVLRSGGKVLLTRLENDIIPGTWGLPYERVPAKQNFEKIAARLNRRLIGGGTSIVYCSGIRHSITRHRITAHIFRGNSGKVFSGLNSIKNGMQWATGAQQRRMLTSSLFKKALENCRAN